MSTLHVVGAAIEDESGRYLVAQRSASMAHPLCWEFPGGKIEAGESPQTALERELMEELGIKIQVSEFIARGRAVLASGLELVLDVYQARWVSGELALREHAQVDWVRPGDFGALTWPQADMPAVHALMQR